MKKYQYPSKKGEFGMYGGRYIPPQLEALLVETTKVYEAAIKDKAFNKELKDLYKHYVGRPSALYFARQLSKEVNGAKIYFKREDLDHTGAHKINNTLGQVLLAKKMGKTKIIAETGAGQHGVATATAAAMFGMKCEIYMGKRDVVNQKVNVYRMRLLGAKVVEVGDGQGTLKNALDAAFKILISDPTVYYLLGSVVGPHPYPVMVRDFQKIIGQEAKKQILQAEGKLPEYLVACVGGGSNAMGLFYEFIKNDSVQLIAVEPAGLGEKTKRHGLALKTGKPGVFYGFKSLFMMDKNGKLAKSYSCASGLDFPGVGPEPSLLKKIDRLQVVGVTDKQAVKAFIKLSRIEGIIPALESAHAVYYAMQLAKTLSSDKIVLVNLSGRGDKDVENVYENLITDQEK